MSGAAFWLLAALLFAHYLGDFTPLATRRMLGAKLYAAPLGPFIAHAGVHTLLVGLVIAALARPGWSLVVAAAAIVFVTHFGLDMLRSRLGRRFPKLNDPDSRAFWSVLGLDQFGHAAVLAGLTLWVTRGG